MLVEQTKSKVDSVTILKGITSVLQEHKVLDLRTFQGNEDYFVDFVALGTGTSDRHIDAMAEKVCKYVKQYHLIAPRRSANSGGWIAIDFCHGILHLMLAAKRVHYDIDSLMLEIGNKEVTEEFGN